MMCNGCGIKLGFTKYKFRGMWRVQGLFCKSCMKLIGENMDKSHTGTTDLEKQQCTLCKSEFYFLQSKARGEKFCKFCYDVVTNGPTIINSNSSGIEKLPKVNMIWGILGLALMIAGLVFTFANTSQTGGNLLSIIFGSMTTATGFIIFRKTLYSRRLLYGDKKTCMTK